MRAIWRGDLPRGRLPGMIERQQGRLECLAYERAEHDAALAGARGYLFDEARADRIVRFFGFLRQTTGEWAGQPFDLLPWQVFCLRQIFGWVNAEGMRRYRTAYVEVPRKNGKSTWSGGVALYLLTADGEAGAQVYSAATAERQAKIIFDEARKMARMSPQLRKRLTIQQHLLRHSKSESFMRAVSSQARTLDGLNSHGLLIDELQAHVTSEVFDVLDTSRASRRQPLTVMTTTAGVYRPESIGWKMHDMAVKVLERSVESDSFFAFIAAADDNEDWRDEATWAKANPSFGITVKPEVLREEADRALTVPSEQNTFRRLHLNEWTQQAVRWLDMADWHNCGEPLRPLEGRACYAGLDMASTSDLTALVLYFPADDGTADVLPLFWCPRERVFERAHNDRVPYDTWMEQGYITATPGDIVDQEYIRSAIHDLRTRYNIRQVIYDRWGMAWLAVKLEEDGFDVAPLTQGYATLNAPTLEVERLVRSASLRHGGHPVLTWMASNVTLATQNSGYVKPDKAGSAERIDGIIGLVMAASAAVREPEEAQWESVFV